jgi:undecaprenyl phosphate-alpha-L-ara4FN deformylase
MRKLVLKVDVDTLRGTEQGVPRLVELFGKHRAGATFLFSLGPDHTGRAIKRVLRPGFLNKVSRTSVVEHYGIKTLLYGTLLPGPNIGRRCAPLLRSVHNAGFEVGIHTYDHVKWQDQVCRADGLWASREMRLAAEAFHTIFGMPARTHGAAGWQMSADALRLTQAMGFDYCSDARGTFPFWPSIDTHTIACPQLPTTLPTMDELIGLNGATVHDAVESLLQLTKNRETPQVYTLHAELEGRKLLEPFARLLSGWRSQGYQLLSLRQCYESLEPAQFPVCEVYQGEVHGRSGTLLCQGRELPDLSTPVAARIAPSGQQ